MSWIEEIGYDQVEGPLKKTYERVKGPNNNVDNILLVHSLRPHTLTGHMGLYKNVLHNSNNTLPKWYLETLGVYVSYLNQCDYCVEHHFAGLQRLLGDREKGLELRRALEAGDCSKVLSSSHQLGVKYARLLTQEPQNISENHIHELRNSGFSDGEILEINQVVSYFNYANRTVLGLGVSTDGDILGLSPNDSSDAANWSHS